MPGPSAVLDQLAAVVGADHVLTDPGLTEGYVTDWSGRWRGHATAVVRPGSTAEVAAVVRVCASAGVAVVPQGGNTGLVNGSIPHAGEVVVSTQRLDRIEGVDPVGGTIAAGAGVTVADAHRAAVEHGLAFPIDLASRDSATLGGIVATNAGGVRVVRRRATRAHVLGIEAVLADGSVLRRWTGLEKDNVGYDLPGLLTGSEGTLAIVTGVLMRLVTPAVHVQVLLVAVPSLDAALVALDRVRRSGLDVEAAEFFGQVGLDLVCGSSGLRQPFAEASPYYLLVELSGGSDEAVIEVLEDLADVIDDGTVEAGPGRRLWAYREGHTESVNAASATPPVKLDVAVPLARHAVFERVLRTRVAEAFPEVRLVTFGHIAEGNVHVNLLDVDRADVDAITDLVFSEVAAHGGSISAEHGIGRSKLPWIGLGRSAVDLATMRAIKDALDPHGLFNPGVLIPPASSR